MSAAELLTLDDPLLPRVRAAAARGSRHAHVWLLDSAKHWAVREFARREEYREKLAARGEPVPEDRGEVLREDMLRLCRHQVAVLLDLVTDAHARVRPEAVRCGFLRGGDHEYIDLDLGGAALSGMMPVRDVVELHPAFRLRAWPEPRRAARTTRTTPRKGLTVLGDADPEEFVY